MCREDVCVHVFVLMSLYGEVKVQIPAKTLKLISA